MIDYADIRKAISELMARMAVEQERALFGLPATPTSASGAGPTLYQRDWPMIKHSDPGGNWLTAAASIVSTTTGPNLDALNALAVKAAETRRKLGVAGDGAIWYIASELAPKDDPATGAPVFYFLETHGYYIIHPANVSAFRSLENQGRSIESLLSEGRQTVIFFSVDLKSYYKSIWIGPLLITWTCGVDGNEWPHEISFSWGSD